MTEQVMQHLKDTLYNITAYYAMKDYLRANTDKHGKRYKIHHPYGLSDDTNEARELYAIVYGQNDISFEDESKIKGYILKQRILKLSIFKEATI